MEEEEEEEELKTATTPAPASPSSSTGENSYCVPPSAKRHRRPKQTFSGESINHTAGFEDGPSSSVRRPIVQNATKATRQKKGQPSELAKQLDKIMAYAKAIDVQRIADSTKDLECANDMLAMQVDPNVFTPRKKGYWEREQKIILDREMANECPTLPSSKNSNTAMRVDPNVFSPKKKLYWERKQKMIMDHEMTDKCPISPPPMNSNTVRNLSLPLDVARWVESDSDSDA